MQPNCSTPDIQPLGQLTTPYRGIKTFLQTIEAGRLHLPEALPYRLHFIHVLALIEDDMKYATRLRVAGCALKNTGEHCADGRKRIVTVGRRNLHGITLHRHGDPCHHLTEQVRLVAKMPVHRSPRDIRGCRNARQGRSGNARLTKYPFGSIEYFVPGQFRRIFRLTGHRLLFTAPLQCNQALVY